MDMGGPSTNESLNFYNKSGETYNANKKTRQHDKNDGSDEDKKNGDKVMMMMMIVTKRD